MTDTTDTESVKAKGWTDAEKVALLLSMINAMGAKVPWDVVEVPPGRTKKAAKHMFAKVKEQAKSFSTSTSDVKGSNENKSAGSKRRSTVVDANRIKKPKFGSVERAYSDDGNEDDDGGCAHVKKEHDA